MGPKAGGRTDNWADGRVGGQADRRTGEWAGERAEAPVAVAMAVHVNFASPPQNVPLINFVLPIQIFARSALVPVCLND